MHKSFVVLALLAGCGDDGVHKLADAPPAPDDAAVDAPTSGTVTLTVVQDGTPRPDVAVFFVAADNSLVAEVMTNAQGVASATMGLGGSVTAIDPFLAKVSYSDLRTFVGVKPGDNLHLTSGTSQAQNTPTNFSLSLPADPNASSYEVYTNCGQLSFSGGGGSGSNTLAPGGTSSVLYGCGATVDMLVESFDINGIPLGSFYKGNLALAEGATIDLTAETFTAVPTGTINWTNVPASYSSIFSRVDLASPKGPLSSVFLSSTPVAAGTSTSPYARPGVTGGTTIVETAPDPSGIGEQTLYDWTPQAAAPVVIDVGSGLLGTYTVPPSVSPATRTITWAASAGVAPDFVWAELSASRTVGQNQRSWRWAVIAPYAATTFTLPLLPAGATLFNFEATDQVSLFQLVTAKVPGGYDAVRADILTSNGPRDFVKSASGRIVVEMIAAQPTLARMQPSSAWTARPVRARK